MAPLIPGKSIKAIWYALATLIVLSCVSMNKAQAFQKKSADTVSSNDVQFTDIQTATDSAATKTRAAVKTVQQASKDASKAAGNSSPEKQETIWAIFIAGFLGGFAAFLMPCIYPLLPLTVSFFTKQSGTRAGGIIKSAIYGLSIIVIYVTLGLIITISFKLNR